jgi:hypothetical protein
MDISPTRILRTQNDIARIAVFSDKAGLARAIAVNLHRYIAVQAHALDLRDAASLPGGYDLIIIAISSTRTRLDEIFHSPGPQTTSPEAPLLLISSTAYQPTRPGYTRQITFPFEIEQLTDIVLDTLNTPSASS